MFGEVRRSDGPGEDHRVVEPQMPCQGAQPCLLRAFSDDEQAYVG